MGVPEELKSGVSEAEQQDDDGTYRMDLVHHQGESSKTKRKKTESRNVEAAGRTKKPAGRPPKYITKEQKEEEHERKIARDQERRANRTAESKRFETGTKGYKNGMEELISSLTLFKITDPEPLKAVIESFQNEVLEFQKEDLKLQDEFKELTAEMKLLQDKRDTLIYSSLQHQITDFAYLEDLDKKKERIQIDKNELKEKIERLQNLNEELLGFIGGLHITSCKFCSHDLKVEFERLQNRKRESKLKTKFLRDEILELKALIKELKPEIKKLENLLNVEIEKPQNEMKPEDYLDKPLKMKADFSRTLKHENLRLENMNLDLNAELDRLKDQNKLLACLRDLIINLKGPFPDQIKNIQANVEMGSMLEANTDNIVEDTLQLIEDNLMADLCDHSVENPDHFMNELRKCCGKSPDDIASYDPVSGAYECQLPPNDHGKLASYVNEMWATCSNITNMHDKYCYACQSVEKLMEQLNNAKRSMINGSDFMNFNEEWKRRNGNKVPPYLEYVHLGINRDITAPTTFADDVIELPRALFYAVIDEMGQKQLEEINEDVILKWGFVIRDARRMNMDVEFAMEHLKKIAHAYFSMAFADKKELQAIRDKISTTEITLDDLKRSYNEKLETLKINMLNICATEEATFDGVPLNKGIFPYTPME